MVRNIKQLQDRNFDILIIGGGISGAALAWDASLRGLKTALIEKKDFGWATSAATSKMIHGGLRYLANFEFKVVRESLRERRHLEKIMPHLAFPLPFLLPVYNYSGTPKWMLRIGLSLYDILSFDKNFIDDPDKYLSNHRWYNKEETLAIEPGLDPNNLKGAFHYYDVQNVYTERANLEFILSAQESGAIAANYVEALKITTVDSGNKKQVDGVMAKDLHGGGDPFKISASVVINATGPWADRFISSFSVKKGKKVIRSKGIHLLFPKIANQAALAIETKDHKHFFILPWLNYTLIGTTDTKYEGDLDSVRVTKKEAQEFLDLVNAHFPANLTLENILHAYAGVRPLAAGVSEADATYNISRKHELIDHGKKNKIRGFYSVFGGKWTTSRALAQFAISKILKRMNIPALPCNTAKTPLTGGKINGRFSHWKKEKQEEYAKEFDPKIAEHMVEYYGANCERLFQIMRDNPKTKRPIAHTTRHPLAQIEYAVKKEAALTLSDFLMRRSVLGNTGIPPHETVLDIAEHMGALLNWSKAEQTRQIEAYLEEYRISGM